MYMFSYIRYDFGMLASAGSDLLHVQIVIADASVRLCKSETDTNPRNGIFWRHLINIRPPKVLSDKAN